MLGRSGGEMFCPRCRAPIVQGSSFCNRCGAPLSPFAPAQAARPRSRAPLVLGLLALVVVVLGGLAALVVVLWLANAPIRCSADEKCAPVARGGGKVVVETTRDIVVLDVPKGAVDR